MAKLIPLTEVVVPPDRQRTSFDPEYIQELAISIRDNCLMHAPVMDEKGLIAGECRLEAVKLLNEMGEAFWYDGEKIPEGMLPYVSVNDLTLVQRFELELEENIRRKDLTWQERTRAIARLAALKTEIITAETGRPPTTRELQSSILELDAKGNANGKLRTHLDLAQNLDRPEIAKAKTQQEAIKTLKRIALAEQHAKIAELAGESYTASSHQLYHADAEVWMGDAAPEQFDVILTDPPYGMGADDFGDSGGKAGGAHGYSDSAEILQHIHQWFPAQAYRLAKPQAHLYVFCDLEWFKEWRAALAQAGWKVFRTPLIWFNPTKYRAPWPEHGPQRKWEMCVYAVKGDKPVTRLYPDVITCQADENLGHAAQKPVALYTDLLQRSALPGSRVLDPFVGSGPIFEAAHTLHCTAVGVERDAVHYGIATARLTGLSHEQDS